MVMVSFAVVVGCSMGAAGVASAGAAVASGAAVGAGSAGLAHALSTKQSSSRTARIEVYLFFMFSSLLKFL
jgi:hypothetical protein